jgi:hypothetical protein
VLHDLRRGADGAALRAGMSGDAPPKGTLRVAPGEGPLRAEHERLLRTALKRGALDPEAAVRGARLEHEYHPTTLELARLAWFERMRREHHSSAVFSRLLPQLIEAGATLDVKTSVLRMSMDELRHGGLCGGVLELLGARPELETELVTEPLPEHPTCTPIERALRNVVFIGCLNETIGVAMLTEERALAREPAISAVLDQLAADEVWHAKLGWLYLAEVWPALDDIARQRTNAYLRYAFGYLEAALVDPISRVRFDDALTEELNALGVAAPQDMRELFYEALESIVLPQLEAQGVHARAAWAERTR